MWFTQNLEIASSSKPVILFKLSVVGQRLVNTLFVVLIAGEVVVCHIEVLRSGCGTFLYYPQQE
jgi:hypothetical protein